MLTSMEDETVDSNHLVLDNAELVDETVHAAHAAEGGQHVAVSHLSLDDIAKNWGFGKELRVFEYILVDQWQPSRCASVLP